jgi:hypothetical protein
MGADAPKSWTMRVRSMVFPRNDFYLRYSIAIWAAQSRKIAREKVNQFFKGETMGPVVAEGKECVVTR